MILQGNALHLPIADNTMQCCVTSPPYFGLRNYNVTGQLGLEPTPDEYVANMVQVFREVKRVLKDDGVVFLNLGDSYATHASGGKGYAHNFRSAEVAIQEGIDQPKPSATQMGLKEKDLIGIPWMVAFALRADGWYLRSDIIWSKPNPMPESVKDRPTKAHEYVFLLTKSAKYYYDNEAIYEVATGYDGRKDTMMKGSPKYANGFVPDTNAQTVAVKGHERWSKKMPPIGGVKAPGNNGNPTYSGNTPEWRKMKGRTEGGGGTGFAHQSGGYDMETGEWMGGNIEGLPARNKRSVWTINTQPYRGAHFAVMPEKLVEPCVLAGSRPGDVILDPFAGSGTVGVVAQKHGRQFIGVDLNPEYVKLAVRRLQDAPIGLPMFREEEL